MAYAVLAAGIYVGALGAFISAEKLSDRIFFKAPLFPVSAVLIADASGRLGWI